MLVDTTYLATPTTGCQGMSDAISRSFAIRQVIVSRLPLARHRMVVVVAVVWELDLVLARRNGP